MNNKDEDILYRDLEIPEIIWEKANVAFGQIHMEEERILQKKERWGKDSTCQRRLQLPLSVAFYSELLLRRWR